MYRVLVIGGYGFFGRRLVERLLRQPGLQVIICGRSAQAAEQLAAKLRPGFGEAITCAAFDAMSALLTTQLVRLAPQVVVHASGPFQGQNYSVADTCISLGIHYIDLADSRLFVEGIRSMDCAARQAGVLVTSGASSVPALSSAAVDFLAADFAQLNLIDIGISPGNRTERGFSTVQAVTSYCGKPLPGQLGAVVGWQGSYRHEYDYPVGSRLLSPCDVPDLTLLGARYPGRPAVRFGAGLELEYLHRAMNLMAWMTQRAWVSDWSAQARWIKPAADLFRRFGSDSGAMHVSVSGSSISDGPIIRSWQLMAMDGDGSFVPTLAAAALVRKLAGGDPIHVGALPCMGLLTLADFEREAYGLNIVMGRHD